MGKNKCVAFNKKLPDVSGKVFVITGTTSGVGQVAAQLLAERGGEVVMLNRPSSRADAALAKLAAAVPAATFVQVACDLQDFASVRAAAAEVRAKYDKIFCLANNAGVNAMPDVATQDGYDVQVQTNVLSHFLLTKELFPLLVAGEAEWGEARVVHMSSGARDSAGKDGLEEKYFGKNGGNLGGYKPGMAMTAPQMVRYSQTKLANSVFSQALHAKFQANDAYKNFRSIAAHPGGTNSDLFNTASSEMGWASKKMFSAMAYMFFQSCEDGAMGLSMAMMDPKAQSGVLYGPKMFAGVPVPQLPKAHENGPEAMELLWRKSEEAVGTFEI